MNLQFHLEALQLNAYICCTMCPAWSTELEQSTPVDYIKGSVQSSVWVPTFNMKNLKDVLAETL